MSELIPSPARGHGPEADHPRLQQRPLDEAERRARWEVRAAQWRALELAEDVFGAVSESALVSARPYGRLRGLLTLSVPFMGLELHREREARFLAAVSIDPLLTRVPLVYVLGPSTA